MHIMKRLTGQLAAKVDGKTGENFKNVKARKEES